MGNSTKLGRPLFVKQAARTETGPTSGLYTLAVRRKAKGIVEFHNKVAWRFPFNSDAKMVTLQNPDGSGTPIAGNARKGHAET